MKGDFSMIARVLALGLAIALAGAPAVAQDRAALIARGQKLFPKISMTEAEARALAAWLASLR